VKIRMRIVLVWFNHFDTNLIALSISPTQWLLSVCLDNEREAEGWKHLEPYKVK
jgi:hypothetical protein